MIADPPRLDQAVAKLAQIARAATTGHNPAQCAAQIGQGAQHGAQIPAQQRVVVQPLDQCQPRPDRRGVGQWG